MKFTLLRGHNSPETGYLVDDYPYGSNLRCKIRYWVERAVKGSACGQMRFCHQTTNPKKPILYWNKEKYETYSRLVYMYRDESNGYIDYASIHYSVLNEYAKLYAMGLYQQLNEEEKGEVDKLVAEFRRENPVTSEEWDRDVGLVKVGVEKYGFVDNLYELIESEHRIYKPTFELIVNMLGRV